MCWRNSRPAGAVPHWSWVQRPSRSWRSSSTRLKRPARTRPGWRRTRECGATSPGCDFRTTSLTSTDVARASAVDRALQLGLRHLRAALDVLLLGLVVELVLGPAAGALVRSQ